MKKEKTEDEKRIVITVSIDRDIAKRAMLYCVERDLSRSKLIQNLLEKTISQKELVTG